MHRTDRLRLAVGVRRRRKIFQNTAMEVKTRVMKGKKLVVEEIEGVVEERMG